MYEFGNWLTRAIRNGATLLPAEAWLLTQLVSSLPDHLSETVRSQFDAYDLAQREVDGRAVNFYCRPNGLPDLPLLKMEASEAPMVRISAEDGRGNTVHAVLVAASGRVFCMSLSRAAVDLDAGTLRTIEVTRAWRSNFPA